MKCPECEKEGQRSTVFSGGGTVTLMSYTPFWDEDGVYHVHDPNTHGTNLSCSRGHKWSLRRLAPCGAPGCNYGKTASTK